MTDSFEETPHLCTKCGGECRIRPSWSVMAVGHDLWVSDIGDEHDVWKLSRRQIIHVELAEEIKYGNSTYTLSMSMTAPTGRWQVLIHTRHGRHHVHTCADREHAEAMREDIVTCLGWVEPS